MPRGNPNFGKPGFKGPGRPRGLKNRETLDKEARRAMFDEKISHKWEEIIDKLKPEYVADQFIGKAVETIKHEGLEFLFEDNEKKD